MGSKDIKLKEWPFDKGARVKLEWIGAPFKHDKKMYLPVYFNGKINSSYKTERLVVDWGVLSSLIIQHYYVDGIINKPIPPNATEEVTLIISPNQVEYFERPYPIRATNFEETSQIFIVKYNGEKYYLPLIEVIRGILAPNAFLLNCLFEMHSFPQYFVESIESNSLKLDFTAAYNYKYLKSEYLYQLVWLLMNRDVRRVFENFSSNFHFKNTIQFKWIFQNPIKLKLNLKKTANGYTVLNIKSVLEKNLHVYNLEISHPSLIYQEKSNESKKRMSIPLSSTGDYEVDSAADGRTNEFDEVSVENLTHEYMDSLRITRRKENAVVKRRDSIDENTKMSVKQDNNRRSMGDIGGSNILRGLEVKTLENTYVNGELAEFKEILGDLSRAHYVESVEAYIGNLTDIGERSFAFLDDGVTPRRYIVAYIKLRNGKEITLLEIERAGRSVSTLVIEPLISLDMSVYVELLLKYIILSSGSWLNDGLRKWDKAIAIYKVKHTSRYKQSLINKIL